MPTLLGVRGLGPAPGLVASLTARGLRGERAPIELPVGPGVLHRVSQAFLERLGLDRLGREMTLDARESGVGLVEALRWQEVGDLPSVGKRLPAVARVTQLVEIVPGGRGMDRQRVAGDDELAAVHDVALSVSHEVALGVDHGGSDELRQGLAADRVQETLGRRRIGTVDHRLEVLRRKRFPAELCVPLEILVTECEASALAVEAGGPEAELVLLDPRTTVGRERRDLGLLALGLGGSDLVVAPGPLGHVQVDAGVADAGVGHAGNLLIRDLRESVSAAGGILCHRLLLGQLS